MLITLEERAKLRFALERDIVAADDGEKSTMLVMLALLYDLDAAQEKNELLKNDVTSTVLSSLRQIVDSPQAMNEEYFYSFTRFAEALARFSERVWEVKQLLDALRPDLGKDPGQTILH